ncbi:terminase gpP N-terminus-related DNA-binding protein [Furfurilactobacillus sp. WILCCON 0119]
MAEQVKQAEQDYMAGMKYKDIAAKYDVSMNTVKSWKTRHGWSRSNDAPPKTKRVHTQPKKGAHKSAVDEDVLEPRQELFAQLVGGQRLPLYRAYQIAFDAYKRSDNSVMSASSKLAKQPAIRERINKISAEAAAKHKWSLDRVLDSLTFIHDEAKAAVYMEGPKKGNTDAMMNALDRIVSLLRLDDASRDTAAKARITEHQADEIEGKGATNPLLTALSTQATSLIPEEANPDEDTTD